MNSLKPRIGQILRTVGALSAVALLAIPFAALPAAAHKSNPLGQVKPGRVATERPIVFASDSNNGGAGGRTDIYTINADGSGLVDLTPTNTGALRDPAWIPNSSTIAYTAPGPLGGRYLYAMKQDGSQPTQLTTGLYDTDSQPAWSPDGLSLAFISDRGGNPQVWTLSLVDGTLRQLTTAAGTPGNPSWSPDGANIVYSSAGSIYIIASTGSEPQLFVLSSKARTPDWSPDGNFIAYVDGESVWTRSVNGLTTTLVGTYAGASSPRWSPDGTRLTLIARDNSGHSHLYLLDGGGNWVKQVTAGPTDDMTPDW